MHLTSNCSVYKMLSPHKIDKCQELEGCLGIKLEEFEIKRRKMIVTGMKIISCH
ncbi:hypothetical protein NQ318_001657 [Aromia moschata]|uniref:Uncharacterized protein n=1 Tax=Aromia moschata TaxID=1265417 RepID=A0AAV8XAQ1_9CUCU|nr:hypothetical protein NQ318_001657 [Aromia moschata]